MKTNFLQLFSVPVCVIKLDDNDDVFELFSTLTENIFNSTNIEKFKNYAKDDVVTTENTAWQIKIKTKQTDPDFFWDNEWWSLNSNCYSLLTGILDLCQDYYISDCINAYGNTPDYHGFFIKDFWIVKLKEHENNLIHSHPQSTFSGVYYQTIPECIKNSKDSKGNIFFLNNSLLTNFEFSFGSGQTFSIKPEEGMMLIFPSWLSHYVTSFVGQGERISYSFNIIRQ